ncbi:hypothetical protein G6F57_011886 [Rhizopus arrhizus]|uniref:Tafazzin family protein n=1 Tax=Rhizopus oryzae TaxID=64495 RepID=A0A9P7BT73_RHIOR|nr:hypothetical protein G6F23_009324 [Rhizopus arrhizus]KAG1406854.1 hypothetical protein G6F58_009755 [Rhizopus delemar]KAG0755919.1 hypothetical protein G6F24_011509 [Rhizopus arrhizus]KAG0781942.1 hypothetical protein G6F21_011380 [Rhizopus arrhizus]KAG0783107.1 hypothetical protein G6F22_008824 [Rhizopus arrhizus]
MTRRPFLRWTSLFAAVGGGAYYYQKNQNYQAPTIPYVPPPFLWETIPAQIAERFTVPHPVKDGFLWNMASRCVMGVTGLLAKGFLMSNQTRVYGLDSFMAILDDPERTRGVITVSNHKSTLDDPCLWGVLPIQTLFTPEKMRWVLGAADICYTSLFRSYFFAFGQAIPTIRGGGIYQPGVDYAIHILNQGAWVHMYPEAKVNQAQKMIRFKWGIGRMVMDMEHEPIVIPIWHQGMELTKPLYDPTIYLNKPIVLVFGKPIDYHDIITRWKQGELTREEARIQLTTRFYEAIERLGLEYQNS